MTEIPCYRADCSKRATVVAGASGDPGWEHFCDEHAAELPSEFVHEPIPDVPPRRALLLTLDADCVLPIVDRDCGTAYRDELDALVERAERGDVRLFYTGTLARELARGDSSSTVVGHPAFAGMVPGMARLDVMRLDDVNTVLAPDSAPVWDEILRSILVPGGVNFNEPRAEKKIADVDQVLSHVVAGHDIFVTGNTKDFTPGRVAQLAEHRVVVMTPTEIVARLRDSG
jgi:hypothetical protein